MDRASDSGSEGWGFESLPAYQITKRIPIWVSSLVFRTSCGKGLERAAQPKAGQKLRAGGSDGSAAWRQKKRPERVAAVGERGRCVVTDEGAGYRNSACF